MHTYADVCYVCSKHCILNAELLFLWQSSEVEIRALYVPNILLVSVRFDVSGVAGASWPFLVFMGLTWRLG